MPLTRGRVVGYDANRMTFEFTMMDQGATVVCQISSVALDEISGRRWSGATIDRDAQFEELRETIEKVASEEFDAQSRTMPVRIFAKHIRKKQS